MLDEKLDPSNQNVFKACELESIQSSVYWLTNQPMMELTTRDSDQRLRFIQSSRKCTIRQASLTLMSTAMIKAFQQHSSSRLHSLRQTLSTRAAKDGQSIIHMHTLTTN